MNNRRRFLKNAGIISAAALTRPFEFFESKPKFKLGLQLYTIRESLEKNLKQTFKQIADFGYEEVETYGFNYGKNKNYWGLEPKIAKQLLDDYKLTTSSGHYDLDKFFAKNLKEGELQRYVDKCIEGATALKQSYIVWPWLAPEYRNIDDFKRLAETLNNIGGQIKKGGLQLAYHNHDFEFINHDGKNGYDIIVNETDPQLVKLEMDLYWFMRASPVAPHEWFKKEPGRFAIWHLKDMDKYNKDLHTTLGDGQINFNSILKDAEIAGVKHLFVEQGNNYVPDDLSCVKKSAAYAKKNLL